MKAGGKGRKDKRTKLSYERRLNLAAASAATLYALPSVVSAAIVHVSGAPVSLSAKAPDLTINGMFNASVSWDVDSDGNADFEISKMGTVSTDTFPVTANGYMSLNSGGLNGNGVVKPFGSTGTIPPQAIQAMGLGQTVGPTLGGSYQWGAPGQTNRRMMSFTSVYSDGSTFSYGVNVVSQGATGGFASDQLQYFGFSFTNGGIHYGWAGIRLDTEGDDRRLEIVEWAYEDTAGASIQVGAAAIPIPAHGLAMLAAGAGSVLAMRRKRREAEDGAQRDGSASA